MLRRRASALCGACASSSWAALQRALSAAAAASAAPSPHTHRGLTSTSAAAAAAAAAGGGAKYDPSPGAFTPPPRDAYDVLVLGGGHNGLVAAAYLARGGLSVCVLERRHLLGGAAVTEELIPGFKFSRASYLAGLLRPQIIADLQLPRFGFRYLVRDPSSFTPTHTAGRHGGKSLLLGSDAAANAASIAQFSAADAEAFPRYEHMLSGVRALVTPLLDGTPPDVTRGGARERLAALRRVGAAARAAHEHPGAADALAELLTAPAAHILDRCAALCSALAAEQQLNRSACTKTRVGGSRATC
jgi:phytoene dehydrogenase-like protein